MEQEESKQVKLKMLEFLYRDNDGNLNYYADMIEIGMELKCDEETAKELTVQLHSEGMIQLVDTWGFDAFLTEKGLAYLEQFFIGSSTGMKSFEPKNPGLKQLDKNRIAEGPRKTIPGKVILVIDDDAAVVEGLGRILRGMGYVVDSATDGQPGLQKAAAIRPALIFLDINMPNMDGVGVYDFLRKAASTADIPVVFLTGNAPDVVNSRITPGPETYYLQKPVSVALVRETITKIIGAS